MTSTTITVRELPLDLLYAPWLYEGTKAEDIGFSAEDIEETAHVVAGWLADGCELSPQKHEALVQAALLDLQGDITFLLAVSAPAGEFAKWTTQEEYAEYAISKVLGHASWGTDILLGIIEYEANKNKRQ